MDRGPNRGRIITFYSYKGGTGRSMAVANVAWLLAISGRKVLAIDWDLEAPGLHRYFHPFLNDPDLTDSDGVIDFVINYTEKASGKNLEERLPDNWYTSHSHIAQYACALDYPFGNEGALDFIPAGRQGDAYGVRVNSFNWKLFYEKLGGRSVIDEMARELREESGYEFILIDSRTGVSDTSGICTVQIPDAVVVCFTLNVQSVVGASSAARSIIEQRAKRNQPIEILPVPMRVEITAEKIKYEQVSAFAKSSFLNLVDERGVSPGFNREKYWAEVEVPYIGFYAFEEELAWFLDDPNQVTGVLASMKRLTHHATGINVLELPGPSSNQRQEVLARYGEVWSQPLLTPPLRAPKPLVYFSHQELDRDQMHAFKELVNANILGSSDLPRNGKWAESLRGFLQRSNGMLLLIGKHGMSPFQQHELIVAYDYRKGQENVEGTIAIAPVFLPDAASSEVYVSLNPAVDLRDATQNAFEGMISAALQGPSQSGGNQVCPYPGLRPFRTEEADIFYGRQLYVRQLADQARSSKLILVGGGPGSGKTSVVLAGLVPHLLLLDAPDWKVAVFSMSGDFLRSLSESLVRSRQSASSDEQFTAECASVHESLLRLGSGALRSTISSVLESWPPAERLLIVADNAADQESSEFRALDSLLSNSPAVLLAITETPVTVPSLSTEELRTAIVEPAQRAHLKLENSLLEALVDDLSKEYDQLTLLQFCLQRLWERRKDGELTLSAYEAIGRVANAVEIWAEGQINDLLPENRICALNVLMRLTNVLGRETPSLRTLDAAALNCPKTTLDALCRAGLIIRKFKRSGEPEQYRILHALLFARWPRLSNAVAKDRAFLEVRQVLEASAFGWFSKGSSNLLRGDALESAKRLLASRADDFTDLEKNFIELSDSAVRIEERHRLAGQQLARRRAFGILIGTLVLLALMLIVRWKYSELSSWWNPPTRQAPTRPTPVRSAKLSG